VEERPFPELSAPLDIRQESGDLPVECRQEDLLALETDILQGSLDLLVLKRLSTGPMHGWGIAQDIQSLSGDTFKVGQGSLYPALYRLERQGLVSSSWKTTENNRRARYYALTSAGRRALAAEQEKWERQSQAINLVLRMGAT